MIVRTILLVLLISLTSVSQEVKSEISNESLKVITLNVQNLDKNENARMLDKNLSGLEGLYFCSFSYENLTSYLVVIEPFDMNLLADKLNAYGFGLMEYVITDFDETEYLLHYLNYQRADFDKTVSSDLVFLKTGNYEKDLEAYKKAKDVFLKLNNQN
jgi:hypothetical protein